MQLHQLQPIHKYKQKKQIGRGGKHGFLSGRGGEGQKARAGKRLKPIIRELIKRYPKLRGYRYGSKVKKQKAILNLETLEKKFKAEEKITPETLLERKIISKILGRVPQIKILGKGKITKALTIVGCLLSKSARDKIEKAGGKVSR